MNTAPALLRLLGTYVHANVQAALEYRTSLASQALGMLLTNVMWVLFWRAYFERFALPGWGPREVVTLWSVVCASYGLGNMLCGNAVKLAGMIGRGEMDFYLSLPKPVLPHALVSRMHLVAPGDLLFGYGAYGLIVAPDATHWALFALCTVTGALILISFCVIVSSLAFWLGQAESIFGQLYGVLTHFATYPPPIFQGTTRFLVFSVLPAGFIAGLPVELLGQPHVFLAAKLCLAAAFFVALAFAVFHLGLRRYTSGNLILMRD